LRAWLGACALLGAGTAALAWVSGVVPPTQDVAAHPLAWAASRWQSQPWTVWTAAWVHTSQGSAGGNLLVIAALGVAGSALGAGRRAALALLLAWPLGTLGLVLWPEITSYAGMGGPIHAAAAVLGVQLSRRPELAPLSPLIFAGVGLKLVAEHAWNQPVAFDPSWGFNVVFAAHLTGVIAGALCGVLALLLGDVWLAVRHQPGRRIRATRADVE
jgi:hypothetical protein